jgi:hypothetical protein
VLLLVALVVGLVESSAALAYRLDRHRPCVNRPKVARGTWLSDERSTGSTGEPATRSTAAQGDTLEVVEVRDQAGDEKPTLVVRSGRGRNSDSPRVAQGRTLTGPVRR